MRPVIWLCVLITSYFYCLPLGRFTFVGIASDFRIFDFVILAFWLFNWNYLSDRLRFIHSKRQVATHYVKYIMIVILVSLIFNFIFRGPSYFGPTLIRTYRFLAYLSTLAALIAIVDSRKKFNLVLTVFFVNILIQAILAFLQGIDILPSFWPDYWREMYSFMDSPVATLSPHHKQIGIGVGLYKDYGFAQKLYVRMGYIPDGNGITYNYQPVKAGDSYPVDDDLLLWFKKDFSV